MTKLLAGPRGCCATVHPKRGKGKCLKHAIHWDENGNGWCWYHNPDSPRKFGEGYIRRANKKAKGMVR